MNSKISTADKNILTFTLSALLLSALILGIVFTLEEPTKNDSLPSLDIILSKQKSIETPDKADFLAQNDQIGGGDSLKNVRPQNIKTGITVDDQGNHMQEQLENIPNSKPVKNVEVLTSIKSDKQFQSNKSKPEITSKPNNPNQKLTHNKKIAKLENNISQRIQSYAKRPKSKYISASTKSFEYANYMQSWVKKIERVSNLNYPNEARKRNFVGTLIMTIGINKDGIIQNIKIVQSSGFKSIDDAAIHLVQLSGPFEPFPQTKNKVDVLYITRTWQFLPGNKLKHK